MQNTTMRKEFGKKNAIERTELFFTLSNINKPNFQMYLMHARIYTRREPDIFIEHDTCNLPSHYLVASDECLEITTKIQNIIYSRNHIDSVVCTENSVHTYY